MGLPAALRPEFLDLLACLSAPSPVYRAAPALLLANELEARTANGRGRKYARNFLRTLLAQNNLEIAGTDPQLASHFFKYALSNFQPGTSSPQPASASTVGFPGVAGVVANTIAFMGQQAFDDARQVWEDALDARDAAERRGGIVRVFGTADTGQPYPGLALRAEHKPLTLIGGVIEIIGGTYEYQFKGIRRVGSNPWQNFNDSGTQAFADGPLQVIQLLDDAWTAEAVFRVFPNP